MTSIHPALFGNVSFAVVIKHPIRLLLPALLPAEAIVDAGLTARLCTLSVPPLSTARTT